MQLFNVTSVFYIMLVSCYVLFKFAESQLWEQGGLSCPSTLISSVL